MARLIEADDGRELGPDFVKRLPAVLTGLITVTDINEMSGPPGWRIHQLRGDRSRTWSISISGNRRLTFEVRHGEIWNLDLEDYH